MSHSDFNLHSGTVGVSHDTGGVDIPVNPFLYEMLLQRIVDRIIVSHSYFFIICLKQKRHIFIVLFTL